MSWNRRLAEQEAEERELIRRHGEEEDRRRLDNLLLGGDLLGLEDGRAGMGINIGGGLLGGLIGGLSARMVLMVIVAVVLLLIMVVGQALKRTQDGQQAMYGTPAAQTSTAPSNSSNASPTPAPQTNPIEPVGN
jgi:hypothetical protein